MCKILQAPILPLLPRGKILDYDTHPVSERSEPKPLSLQPVVCVEAEKNVGVKKLKKKQNVNLTTSTTVHRTGTIKPTRSVDT